MDSSYDFGEESSKVSVPNEDIGVESSKVSVPSQDLGEKTSNLAESSSKQGFDLHDTAICTDWFMGKKRVFKIDYILKNYVHIDWNKKFQEEGERYLAIKRQEEEEARKANEENKSQTSESSEGYSVYSSEIHSDDEAWIVQKKLERIYLDNSIREQQQQRDLKASIKEKTLEDLNREVINKKRPHLDSSSDNNDIPESSNSKKKKDSS